jgi:hypothetical protein
MSCQKKAKQPKASGQWRALSKNKESATEVLERISAEELGRRPKPKVSPKRSAVSLTLFRLGICPNQRITIGSFHVGPAAALVSRTGCRPGGLSYHGARTLTRHPSSAAVPDIDYSTKSNSSSSSKCMISQPPASALQINRLTFHQKTSP